uniref:SLX4 interacting protein n=1 Tax=Crocodylus porosus TaxID=8502 RepID=A0A7M4F0W0_CROPO
MCGNFAVLVDFHILPQGPSRDTSWFSDHEKEEVCMLLKDSIDSRVKQYLEARKQRGQWKRMEYTKPIPLSLKGRFFKCRDFIGVLNLCFLLEQKENISNGTSEYFAESAEKKNAKRKKTSNGNSSKPQTREDTMKVYLGSVNWETRNRKNERQTPSDPQSELPVLELENDVNRRQPDDASSQQKLHSAEWLKMRLLSKYLPCRYESNQQRSCGSEEKLDPLKTRLNSKLFAKQDLAKSMSDKESLTLGKNPLRPFFYEK